MLRSTQQTVAAQPLPLEERYLLFEKNARAAFAEYPQAEPLRLLVFKQLLVQRRVDGWKGQVKRWIRPLLKRSRTRLGAGRSDVLIWLETEREVIREALLPVYNELRAREIGTELVSIYGARNLPMAARVFEFPARAGAPQWARGAWETLCNGDQELRDKALERSFYHACAMLQGLYDELERLLDSVRPKVVLCASTTAFGGGALMVAARRRGIASLLLQHGMPGPEMSSCTADSIIVWGPSSAESLLSLGFPQARMITAGSPRHDAMRPSSHGRARAILREALGLAGQQPTLVFFSQGHDLERHAEAATESVRWLERTALRYAGAVNVVVRLHPCESGSLYSGCRSLKVMDRAVDLAIALDGCDCVSSLSSTVLYDGLLYGKPAWQFSADGWPVLAENWRKGLAVRVSSERQLHEMVGGMLAERGAGDVDRTLIGRVFANHGRATQAVADVVEKQLAADQFLAQSQAACDRSC